MKSLQILMITTSHKSIGDNSADTGLWMAELAGPYYVFRDLGDWITLSSPQGGLIPVDAKSESKHTFTKSTSRFREDDQAMYHLGHSLPLNEVKANDYDLVFICGGHGAMFDLANNKSLDTLLENFNNLGKPISAVGSGVVALTSMHNKDGSDFVKGRKLTAYSNAEVETEGLTFDTPYLLESQLLTLGAFYSRSPNAKAYSVVDSNLVTGQNPSSSIETAKQARLVAYNVSTSVEAAPY